MSSAIVERISTLSLSVQQLGRLPRVLDALPSLPSLRGTVQASDVPALFREPYILSGYRPAGQDWHCYLLSLFQWHNESLNVWTHLLAILPLLLRCWVSAGTWGVGAVAPDPVSLPLLLFVLSAISYLLFSTAAHLLQSRSELAHYALFFLDYVGVGLHQYGCALAHYFYSAEPAWHQSIVGEVFLPATAFLAWLSCSSCCYAKLRYRRPYPLQRKIIQLIPAGMEYLLVISPVIHRLATGSWNDPALPFHALQVVFFILAAFFYSCSLPERLFPGRCDIVGHGHQIFHVFLVLCTLCQQEALLEDFAARRESVVQVHGQGYLLLAAASFGVLMLCSAVTAVLMCAVVQRRLQWKQE
ncbi:membrane progestin receptor beta isoform X2 [Brienomyrus brachyistius]|nr:membrane progestin receptor beta isoform X2 [Brienomyrus brachyistius]XP_048841206.1 membrane progestin receptor beta isoform X2 [Brienomyrus brachyistius]